MRSPICQSNYRRSHRPRTFIEPDFTIFFCLCLLIYELLDSNNGGWLSVRERRKGPPSEISLSFHIPTNLKIIIFVYFLPCCEERKRIFLKSDRFSSVSGCSLNIFLGKTTAAKHQRLLIGRHSVRHLKVNNRAGESRKEKFFQCHS